MDKVGGLAVAVIPNEMGVFYYLICKHTFFAHKHILLSMSTDVESRPHIFSGISHLNRAIRRQLMANATRKRPIQSLSILSGAGFDNADLSAPVYRADLESITFLRS
ncbi:hypothetical protein SUGI_0279810 [Cryptomeria japonica]|nr:hypothetical protein SUGI_0279810 [Cryptomeria japonica]